MVLQREPQKFTFFANTFGTLTFVETFFEILVIVNIDDLKLWLKEPINIFVYMKEKCLVRVDEGSFRSCVLYRPPF
mgnify:FL=1